MTNCLTLLDDTFESLYHVAKSSVNDLLVALFLPLLLSLGCLLVLPLAPFFLFCCMPVYLRYCGARVKGEEIGFKQLVWSTITVNFVRIYGSFFLTGLVSALSLGLLAPRASTAFMQVLMSDDGFFKAYRAVGERRGNFFIFWLTWCFTMLEVCIFGLGIFSLAAASFFQACVHAMVFRGQFLRDLC